MTDRLPDGLVPSGTSPTFTQDTLPSALQAEHTLAPGHWAVLNVFEGSLRFVNLKTGQERVISAPDRVPIHPGHAVDRVATSEEAQGICFSRIDFQSATERYMSVRALYSSPSPRMRSSVRGDAAGSWHPEG